MIDVDFGDAVPAGQFCYDICLYDASNNVSQIQTVCVTVEAWGGNASIVGEWVFDRAEPEDDDEGYSISCDNGDSLTVEEYRYDRNIWNFVLNQDGSYYESYDDAYHVIDYDSSRATCTEIYYEEEEVFHDKYTGSWAYNEEEGKLTVIDFGYINL